MRTHPAELTVSGVVRRIQPPGSESKPKRMNTRPMIAWQAPDPLPALNAACVHLWHVPLRATPDEFDSLFALLDTDEQARARRFHFDRHRLAFTVSHAATRMILASYLTRQAAELEFVYNTHGKPRLAGENCDLRFNLSHSNELAVLALSRDTELGVDVEYIKADDKAERLALAKRFFAADEYATLSSLPEELITESFFACWTRKEAYIKLHGLGLSLPLHQFSVSVDPRVNARLISSAWKPGDEQACQLHDVRVPAGYRASLAVHTREPQTVDYFQWSISRGTAHTDCGGGG